MPLVYTDIVVDLSYGDCGKGKVAHHLLKNGEYTHVLRYNGGCNAGHTIYHQGKKFVTHHIPAGVFYGIKSIIGPGCVVNDTKFFQELKSLHDSEIDTTTVSIAKNAHCILNKHLQEELTESKIGTTKRGNGPAYRDKYDRSGTRAEDCPTLKNYTVDLYKELHCSEEEVYLLCEGAQGFGLDIDWGDYPYVTSSHCTSAGALLNGIPWHSVRYVYGVIKAYDTYVGAKNFQLKDTRFTDIIRDLGQEYGATTGRPRQINWLDLDHAKKGATINGITHLIVNKMDILLDLHVWKAYANGKLITFTSDQEMREFITNFFPGVKVTFSYTPHAI
jgi:adenylosuccinate synthase